MGKVIAIHQPNFLPWLGYFYKILKSDIFVFLDNVQYTKNSFINRNKIKTSKGELWLTVPVSFNFGDKINEVRINNSLDWRDKHLKTLEVNYKKSYYFKEIYDLIKSTYYKKDWLYLKDLNIDLILTICEYLNLKRKFINASELGVEGRSTELLISIVKNVGGDIYLSGFGGANYQDILSFEKVGIKLIYYDFKHPIYKQLWGDFMPNLSIIDLLFNYSKQSLNIINPY